MLKRLIPLMLLVVFVFSLFSLPVHAEEMETTEDNLVWVEELGLFVIIYSADYDRATGKCVLCGSSNIWLGSMIILGYPSVCYMRPVFCYNCNKTDTHYYAHNIIEVHGLPCCNLCGLYF